MTGVFPLREFLVKVVDANERRAASAGAGPGAGTGFGPLKSSWPFVGGSCNGLVK